MAIIGVWVFLPLPLRVELGDCRADRETPCINREVFELIRHYVAVLRFFGWDSRLVHFFGLSSDVIKHFADRSDAFLAANLAVTRDKKRVLIERRKLFQGVEPAGKCCLLLEADRLPAAEEKVASVYNILVGDSRDAIRS